MSLFRISHKCAHGRLRVKACRGVCCRQFVPVITQKTKMIDNAEVKIRRFSQRGECEVVVAFRGREMILRCPDYDQAVKWARLECKTYKISQALCEDEPQVHHSLIE